MNDTKIKELIKLKGYTVNSLSKTIGISHGGLYKGLKTGTIKAITLEKIAKVLNVPVATFFDEEPPQKAQKKQFIDIDNADKNPEIEFMRMALCSVQIGVNYIQADLIKRTFKVLHEKEGDFSVNDAASILHQWQADWDYYFNKRLVK